MKTWNDLYRDSLREIMNDRADDVSTGSAQDYADYRHKVGVIEGLALAEREFLDILERIKKSEEG